MTRLTKQLAVQTADLLDLSALEPHEELEWDAVREIAASAFEGQLDNFQLGLLTDWTYKIADARLAWRRQRSARKFSTGS